MRSAPAECAALKNVRFRRPVSSATVNFVTSSMRLPGLGMRFVRGVVTTARLKAGGRAGLERGDGNKARPVLIGARIQPQQLADSADVQPGEQRSALWADARAGT